MGPGGGLGRGLRGKCKIEKKNYIAMLMFCSFLEE
jgi:hypothetical protein